MKLAFPPRWQILAVPFAASGVVALLFAWAIIAISGIEQISDPLSAMASPMPATPPVGRLAQQRAIAWAHSPPSLFPPLSEQSAEERLAASANLLDFVESIRHRPVPGGHYLALKAYDFCTREARLTLDAMNETSEQPGMSFIADGRQLDALARLAQLCGTFRNRQLLALDYYLIAEEGLQAQDARLVMARRMEKLSAQWDSHNREDAESRQALIADVLRSGDGAMVRDLAGELEVILHTGQMMVGGRIVQQSESADVIDAFRLIACEHGAPCSRENEWQQILACASAAECNAAPPIHHANALTWRDRLREAQQSGPTAIDVVPMELRY